MTAANSTGYGPSRRLYFDGDDEKYELWEIKFTSYLRLQNLHKALADDYEGEDRVDKNQRIFAELVQLLDDKSLSLIIRDAKDDGRAAVKILREHYTGKSKPRIIALYTELTTLKKSDDETATDYLIRADKASSSLKSAGETISDSLLVAMALKGLPSSYSAFATVVTQKDKDMTFIDFKNALKSFEETEKSRLKDTVSSEKVMKTESVKVNNIVCYSCGKSGHKKFQCKVNQNSNVRKSNNYQASKWCSICRTKSHNTSDCRKNTSSKMMSCNEDDNHNDFVMKTVAYEGINSVTYKSNLFSKDNSLLVDCGATSHMIKDKDNFVNFYPDFNSSNQYIELADGSRDNKLVVGKGDAKVTISDVDGIEHDIILKNALCVPSYPQNIFSVHAATEKGASFTFENDHAELTAPNGTIFNIANEGKLYYLYNIRNGENSSKTLEYWHKTMGHCNNNDLLKTEKVVDGMQISSKATYNCESCIKGKMTQEFNRKADKKAGRILDLVHCDLTGNISPVGKGGYMYGISFVDDYSGAIHLYLLKNKNDSSKALETFLSDVAPFGTVKCLRSDNGTEFTGEEFESVLRRNCIKHEFSAPSSPHQNGTVERSWRTVFETARCLLIEADLPKSLWPYAAKYAVYARNRCFNRRLGMTPYEAFTSRKPNLSKMHVFGEKCFAYIQEKKKLDDRSEKGLFVGFDTRSPAYQVYFPGTNAIRKIRCVQFLSTKSRLEHQAEDEEQDQPMMIDQKETDEPLETSNDIQNVEERRYPERNRKPPNRYSQSDYVNYSVDYCYRVSNIPRNYKEAVTSDEKEQWVLAMDEELDALKESDTYESVQLPAGKSLIGSRWVYSVKLGSNDEEKFKARLVAKGYSQTEGIDYEETFSPTAKMTSIRILLQLAVQNDYKLHQLDVKSAYLNANLDAEIYLEQPEGSSTSAMTRNGSKICWKLKKSLYGLKQSGRNWNSMFHSFLTAQGLEQSDSDHCVYTKHDGDLIVIIIIWVDDIIIASNDEQMIVNIKVSLKNTFKMKDLGQISNFLGIDFEISHDKIRINQSKSIDKMLKRFEMHDCKVKLTPCDPSVANLTDHDSQELENPRIYREIVGSLIYVMTCTRPDLCYVVSKLSQFMQRPTNAHLNIAKHVLRYLKGTLDYSLEFCKSKDLNLFGYCDSDWASSEDRKSISGYCFKLSDEGPLISWKSKKQNSVALSSCEAEYVALAFAVQEIKFLHQLLSDMNVPTRKPTNLFVDNQGAIALAKNPVHHQRCKHIDIKYHFVRHEIEERNISLTYIPSEENVADIFTKPLPRPKLSKLIKNVGLF